MAAIGSVHMAIPMGPDFSVAVTLFGTVTRKRLEKLIAYLELAKAMLGHSNAKSTRRYARLADQALVEVLWRKGT